MKVKFYMKVKIGKKSIKVKVADNFWTRSKGLMFKKNIKEDEGMFFVFNKDCFPKFCMFGMCFPLDIIWINSKNRIVDITKNAKPSLNPWKIYKPAEACKYVLEVKANFTEKQNVKINDFVRFKFQNT